MIIIIIIIIIMTIIIFIIIMIKIKIITTIITICGGSETPCNIARYYVMIVHCMVSVLSLVYKIAYFGIHLTNTVSVFRT